MTWPTRSSLSEACSSLPTRECPVPGSSPNGLSSFVRRANDARHADAEASLRSVTGMGYDPTATSLSKKSVLAKKAAAQARLANVKIPDTFLPSRDSPPVDVHQPHGDSSHDTGEDHFHDSPNDRRLDDENLNRHVQGKDDQLFGAGHEEIEKELDAKLNRGPTAEELEVFAQVAEEQAEDTVDISNEDADDTALDEEDADAEDEESEPALEEVLTASELDSDSRALGRHSHEGYLDPDERRAAAMAALREAKQLGEETFDVGEHDHSEGEDESEIELDLSGPDDADAEEEDEDDSVQDQEDDAQDQEQQEDGDDVIVVDEGDEEDVELAEPAALPAAARRRGGKRQIRRLR